MRAGEDYRPWQHGGSTWHQANQNQEKIRAQIRRRKKGGIYLRKTHLLTDVQIHSLLNIRPSEHCGIRHWYIDYSRRAQHACLLPQSVFSLGAQECQCPRWQPLKRNFKYFIYCQLRQTINRIRYQISTETSRSWNVWWCLDSPGKFWEMNSSAQLVNNFSQIDGILRHFHNLTVHKAKR
jgi:hypothetical protein